MGGSVAKLVTFFEMFMGSGVATHNSHDFTFKGLPVQSLEMEDVLFHHNSAVLMPSSPAGESSEDGSEDDATDPDDQATQKKQEQISGIRALACVFKQFEMDNRLRILLAGHTDTSGDALYNFKLSDLRASGVMYLIRGKKGKPDKPDESDRTRWAELCYSKHKVEDYQQIMKYFAALNPTWDCDPGKVDDDWGPNTEKATDNFFKANSLDPSELRKVKASAQKRWTVAAWKAVYDLYEKEMADALGLKKREELQAYRDEVKYLDPERPLVACGESFPVDDAERNSYRSQENRRVEILFFNKADLPDETVIDCPPPRATVHEAKECPLWNQHHLKRTPLAVADLNCTAYHLKFVYYDRIKKSLQPVPGGLDIVVQETTNGASQPVANVRTSVTGGIYLLKVPDNPARKGIHFEFKTTEPLWVFTDTAEATPEIKPSPEEMDKLAAKDRLKYYDLPKHWSSLNYWVRDDQAKPAGKRYQAAMTAKKIKPYGGSTTESDKPLIFSLDDVVLVTSAGSQNVVDRNAKVTNLAPKGEPKDLSKKSRVRILYVDDQDENKMKVFSAEPVGANPSKADVKKDYTGSLVRFHKDPGDLYRNLFENQPSGTRAIIFCGEIYDVTSKRTTQDASYRVDKGHIIGARAAVPNDADVHYQKRLKMDGNAWQTMPMSIMPSPSIGDFSVHYLHGGAVVDEKMCSFLVIYWSSFVTKDTKPGGAGPSAAAVKEFPSVGMYNSMHHWNKKDYQFEEHGVEAKDAKQIIRPFFMFEAFEEFKLTGVPAYDFRKQTSNLVGHAKFTEALEKARGGVPYSLAFVTREAKGSWVRSPRTVTPRFSIVSLRAKTREDDHARFGNSAFPFTDYTTAPFPFTEFNDPTEYGCLAMAHELGHATGQIDDYQDDVTDTTSGHSDANKVSHWVPNYGQFGVRSTGRGMYDDSTVFNDRVLSSEAWPIGHDPRTMMIKNGPIRMRQVWRFTHWLNEGGKDHGSATKPLDKFLKSSQFEIVYRNPDPNNPMRYFRETAEKKDPWAASHGGTIHVDPPDNDRPMQVYLYQNLDETRRLGARDFKGVVVVRPFFMVRFRSRGSWTKAEMRNWVYQLHRRFTIDWNFFPGKYMLSDGSGNDLDPIILRFLPGFDFYQGANPPHNHWNFRLIVRKGNNDWNQSGTRIRLGDTGVKTRKLFYHLFNKPQASTGFTVADFAFIARWFNATVVPSGTFTVRAL